jgi:hypothetical protein
MRTDLLRLNIRPVKGPCNDAVDPDIGYILPCSGGIKARLLIGKP